VVDGIISVSNKMDELGIPIIRIINFLRVTE
jgi:hypothetical protein